MIALLRVDDIKFMFLRLRNRHPEPYQVFIESFANVRKVNPPLANGKMSLQFSNINIELSLAYGNPNINHLLFIHWPL